MSQSKPQLYALDFDGVICDSAIETGITGWKVASQIWPDMPSSAPATIIESFREVRPVMETGYEAVLIIRLLFEGTSIASLLNDFSQQIKLILKRDGLNSDTLKKQFGETRDHWIAANLDEWIEMNPLFEGIANKLRQIDPENAYIITTKQERFVDQIFKANDISFPIERIFGLDRKLGKTQILADLLIKHGNHTILFVEDRLPTLLNVINDERLKSVELFFADWGYNTKQDKEEALKQSAISTFSLADFLLL